MITREIQNQNIDLEPRQRFVNNIITSFTAKKFFTPSFKDKKNKDKFLKECAKDLYKEIAKRKSFGNLKLSNGNLEDAEVISAILEIFSQSNSEEFAYQCKNYEVSNYTIETDFALIYFTFKNFTDQTSFFLTKIPTCPQLDNLKLDIGKKLGLIKNTIINYNILSFITYPNNYEEKFSDIKPAVEFLNQNYLDLKNYHIDQEESFTSLLENITSLLLLSTSYKERLHETLALIHADSKVIKSAIYKLYNQAFKISPQYVEGHLDFLFNEKTLTNFYSNNKNAYINDVILFVEKLELLYPEKLRNIDIQKYINSIRNYPITYNTLYLEAILLNNNQLNEERLASFIIRVCNFSRIMVKLPVSKIKDDSVVEFKNEFEIILFKILQHTYQNPESFKDTLQIILNNCKNFTFINSSPLPMFYEYHNTPLEFMTEYVKDIINYSENPDITPKFFLEPINDYNEKFFIDNFSYILQTLHKSNKTKELHKLIFNSGFEKKFSILHSLNDIKIIISFMHYTNEYTILRDLFCKIHEMNHENSEERKVFDSFVYYYINLKEPDLKKIYYNNLNLSNYNVHRLTIHNDVNYLGSDNCLLSEIKIGELKKQGQLSAIDIRNEISYRLDVQRLRIKHIIENKKVKRADDIFLTIAEQQQEIEFFQYTSYLINKELKVLNPNYNISCLTDNISFGYVLKQIMTLECPVRFNRSLDVTDYSLNYAPEKMMLQLTDKRTVNVLAVLSQKALDNSIILQRNIQIQKDEFKAERSFRERNSTSDSVSYSQSYSQAPSVSMSFRANIYPSNPNEAEIQEALKTEGYQVIKVHGSNTYVAINVNELKLGDYTSNFLEALKKTAEKGYTKDRHDGLRKRKHTYSLRPTGGSSIDDRLESTKMIVSNNGTKFVILDRVVSHKESKKNPSKMKTMSLNDLNPTQIEKL
ncbi:MAG: hypothetical protein J0G32_02055 [Alphaproteobacteria bacterium]|nr:hypothetical protein [Alphaproteobacteria bacterium]